MAISLRGVKSSAKWFCAMSPAYGAEGEQAGHGMN